MKIEATKRLLGSTQGEANKALKSMQSIFGKPTETKVFGTDGSREVKWRSKDYFISLQIEIGSFLQVKSEMFDVTHSGFDGRGVTWRETLSDLKKNMKNTDKQMRIGKRNGKAGLVEYQAFISKFDKLK